MKFKLKTIGILGGGAWGTALSVVAAHRDRKVVVWSRNADVVQAINSAGSNPKHLPGVALPRSVSASMEFAALKDSDAVIVALPSYAVRDTLKTAQGSYSNDIPMIFATKGLQPDGSCITATASEVHNFGQVYVLSGPSFAADVGRQLPAAVVLAGWRGGDTTALAFALATPSLRIYTSDDIAGVQVAGAMKNALAIACGICDGLKLGDSARAGLVTRGFYEMFELGRKTHVSRNTLDGLTGLGDLILTATSGQSRNYSLGKALGEGKTLEAALAASIGVCEGVNAAMRLVEDAAKAKVDVPILSAVAAIVSGKSTPRAEMERLMGRPLTSEQRVG